MMKMRVLLFLLALFFVAIAGMGCLGPDKEKGENLGGVLTASSDGLSREGDISGGPFIVNVTLSETPLLNRTVTATVGVYNPTPDPIANTWLRLVLYRGTPPYDTLGVLVWEKILWIGTIPGDGHVMASGPLKVEEPGYYVVRGWACTPTPDGKACGYSIVAHLFLNVSGERAMASGRMFREPPPPPPPYRPYVIKMELDGVPALNRPVNLRVTIASLMDQKNATFRIFLPEGFELMSGDLVWQGDLQKAMDEREIGGPGETKNKIPEATLNRISEDKKVHMRATIRATSPTLFKDARIFVFPSQEPPPTVACTLEGLNIPHPEGSGWQAISYGGCLNVRVYNESYGLSSEQALPPELRSLKPPPPPETPPPGMRWQDQWR